MAQGDEVLGGEDGHLVSGSFLGGGGGWGEGGMTFGCGWAEVGGWVGGWGGRKVGWGGVDWTGGGLGVEYYIPRHLGR